MKHLNITVSGRVQGVCFRQSTLEEAKKHGLTGWTRNEPDGRVAIAVEGPENALAPFVAWCHHGPSHAHVADITVEEGPVEGFTSFEIRR